MSKDHPIPVIGELLKTLSEPHESPIPDQLIEDCAKIIGGFDTWNNGDEAYRTAFRNIARKVVARSWAAALQHSCNVCTELMQKGPTATTIAMGGNWELGVLDVEDTIRKELWRVRL